MTASSLTPPERARKFVGRDFHESEGPEIARTFNTWVSMLSRALIPGHQAEENYRLRGITVCERWFSFAAFVEDMGYRPAGLTLDRVDNDGNYEPGNCRWADRFTQAGNTSRTKRIAFGGAAVMQADLARRVGVTDATIMRRAARGVSDDDMARKSLCRSKLTAEQVDEIRTLIAAGNSNTGICGRFNVSHTSIRNIRHGFTWGQR